MSATRSAGRIALVALIGIAIYLAVGSEPPTTSRRTLEPTRERPMAPPNILLVSIDTLRADHLGAYGYHRDTSPNIDSLAADGALFTHAISPSAWTLPSHVTLLTSLPPNEHRVIGSNRRLRDHVPTLAEVLAANDYDTAGFVSGPYLQATHGYARGFATYDEEEVHARGVESQEAVTSPGLLRRVSDWLSQWAAESPRKPFFVFLHMWDVHDHYAPPPPYDEMFDPEYGGEMRSSEAFPWSTPISQVPRRELEHLIALYDGEIRFTDEHLGKVLDQLETMGVASDTLVIVTSDHGEEFYEHQAAGHSRSLFDELVNVPLVMRYPARVPAGLVFDRQVRLMDVGPTVLGLVGIPRPENFGSRSPDPGRAPIDLSPWLLGRYSADSLPELPAFLETSIWGNRRTGLRTNQYKLLNLFDSKDGGDVVSRQLYGYRRDADEKQDLLRSQMPTEARFRLESRLDQWNDSWNEPDRNSELVELDPNAIQMLRALGYIE